MHWISYIVIVLLLNPLEAASETLDGRYIMISIVNFACVVFNWLLKVLILSLFLRQSNDRSYYILRSQCIYRNRVTVSTGHSRVYF